jgi:Xaa-Pro aminopeptidase
MVLRDFGYTEKMIDARSFTARRHTLRKDLKPHPLVLTAYDEMQLSADMAAPFRQQSAFLWATGIDRPGWRYVAIGTDEYLVHPNLTKTQLLFDGGMQDSEAKSISGIKEVISWKTAKALLEQAAQSSDAVFTLGKDPYHSHFTFSLNTAQAKLNKELNGIFSSREDCWPILKKHIALKDEAAVNATEAAIKVSTDAFTALKQKLRAGNYHYEYELEADLKHAFRVTGGQGEAYESIVAAGSNACTLHYVANSSELPQNGLVLIDAGALVDGYAADITRTYAIGTPTDRQKAVHKAVEDAHRAIIKLLKPGLSFEAYQKHVDEIMKQALRALGLLTKASDYRNYFPHAIGHGLGLDVHESLGGHVQLQPGMVLTVEPGIYIPEEGIGVRIEDDILITDIGYRILSGNLPTSL